MVYCVLVVVREDLLIIGLCLPTGAFLNIHFFSPSTHSSRLAVWVFICQSSEQYISEAGIYNNAPSQNENLIRITMKLHLNTQSTRHFERFAFHRGSRILIYSTWNPLGIPCRLWFLLFVFCVLMWFPLSTYPFGQHTLSFGCSWIALYLTIVLLIIAQGQYKSPCGAEGEEKARYPQRGMKCVS